MKKPRWAYHPNNKDRWKRLVFHFDFLKKVEEEEGKLWCEYCGKNELVVYSWDQKPNRKDMATVDHFLPRSKYPDLTSEETNFIVACSTCNEKKKDDIWEVETIKHGRKVKEKLNNLN